MSQSCVGAKPRIKVGGAFGQPAEFQRRAAGDARALPASHRDRSASRASRCERLTMTISSPLGASGCGLAAALTSCRPKMSAARRRGRRCRARSSPSAGAAMTPRIGAAAADEADIDGVFFLAGDEFARAVERIDQKIALPLRGRSVPRGLLLRDDRQIGPSRARPSRITASAASSAAVTGEPSALMRTPSLPSHAADCGRRGDADGGQLALDQVGAGMAGRRWHCDGPRLLTGPHRRGAYAVAQLGDDGTIAELRAL